MAKNTYKKKNYLKSLPRVGGTVAMTMALAAALAVPAQATEVEGKSVNQEPVTPVVDVPVADVPVETPASDPAPVAVELPETNEAVEQENNEIVSDNQDVVEDNQDIVDTNEGAAAENETVTDGALEAPELTAPEAPEAPETEGLGNEEYNDAVEDYNDQVDDYNNAADEYNQGVNDYNDAADAYDDKAAADYEQAVEEYEQAVEDRKEAQKEYDEVTLPNWEEQNEAYAEYQKAWNEFLESEKYYYETVVPNYEAEKQAHQEKVTAFDNYQAALDAWKIKYDAYMEQYNSENTEARDQALLEYNQALQEFNDAKKIYTESVAKEEQIYQEVQDYNKDITEKNEQIAEKNEDLKQDINSNYAENLGAAEGNEGVEMNAATKATLEGYQVLAQTQAALEQEAAQLDSHPGKSFGLDTAEYAAYLAAVEAHNVKVNEFKNAVDAYNKAVEDFNAKQEAEEDIFVDTSNSTGTANWGNISINQNTYFNHIDVKYAAAVSQDKLMDENGNPVTDGEDSYSKYTVTGVYTDAAAAERDSDRYGVSYRNNSNDRTQTHYIESLPEHHEFGHPSHTGARLDPETGEISFYVRLVDEETKEEYGITVNMDAASTYPPGTYYKAIGTDKLSSFRDSDGKALQTVWIDNEEYFDISGQSVFVISALTCDGMSQWGWNGTGLTLNPNGLDLVLNMQTLIEIHKAGNAQKLGYVNYSYGKTAHNGEVREKEYTEGDPGEFDWTDLPCDPPDFDSEVVEKPDPFDKELPPPPEFKGEYVENPGDRPNRPEDYEGKAPEAPKPTVRLDTLEMLEKLYDKVIVTWTPEDPTPGETPEDPAPWAIPARYYEVEEENDGPVRILDEAVPLAAAPRTGDISGLWAAISAASLAGMAWLGLKRKED